MREDGDKNTNATKTQRHILDKIAFSAIKIVLIVFVSMQFIMPLILVYKNLYKPRISFEEMPEDYSLEYSTVEYKTDDNMFLRGWYIPYGNSTDKSPAILMVHGIGTNRADLMDMASVFHKNGYSVLTFDLRGHGLSDGNLTTFCGYEEFDIEASLKYLAQQNNVDEKRLAIYGVSMGASCSILSYVERDFVNKNIDVLVLDSPYHSLAALLEDQFPYYMGFIKPLNSFVTRKASSLILGKNVFEVEPSDIVNKIYIPTFFIHGAEDTLIPRSHSEILFENKSIGEKEILLAPLTDHLQSHKNLGKEYEDKIISFLDKYLK